MKLNRLQIWGLNISLAFMNNSFIRRSSPPLFPAFNWAIAVLISSPLIGRSGTANISCNSSHTFSATCSPIFLSGSKKSPSGLLMFLKKRSNVSALILLRFVLLLPFSNFQYNLAFFTLASRSLAVFSLSYVLRHRHDIFLYSFLACMKPLLYWSVMDFCYTIYSTYWNFVLPLSSIRLPKLVCYAGD